MKKLLFALVALLAALSLFSSCGKTASVWKDGIENYSIPAANKNENSGLSNADFYETPEDGQTEQKLTVNSRITAETKEFAEALEKITGLVRQCGGYISSSSQSDMTSKYGRRRAEMTLRVPSEKFEEFTEALSGTVSVTSQETNISDITESYYSAKSSYDSLLVQEQRLLAMLEKADTLSDMLVIEDKLADVRQKIQYYETLLKTYDNKVSYSTVTLSLSEVTEYTEPEKETFWSRISNAFRSSWENFGQGCQDFAVWIVEALPAIVILAVIIIAIIIIVKAVKRKNRRKFEEKRQQIAREYAEKQKAANGSAED